MSTMRRRAASASRSRALRLVTAAVALLIAWPAPARAQVTCSANPASLTLTIGEEKEIAFAISNAGALVNVNWSLTSSNATDFMLTNVGGGLVLPAGGNATIPNLANPAAPKVKCLSAPPNGESTATLTLTLTDNMNGNVVCTTIVTVKCLSDVQCKVDDETFIVDAAPKAVTFTITNNTALPKNVLWQLTVTGPGGFMLMPAMGNALLPAKKTTSIKIAVACKAAFPGPALATLTVTGQATCTDTADWFCSTAKAAQCAPGGGKNLRPGNNGPNGPVPGAGAGAGGGGTATPSDGLGKWTPGEGLKGPMPPGKPAPPATPPPSGVDFSFRLSGFREAVCLYSHSPGGTLDIRFPLITFLEIQGNQACPTCFTNPGCASAGSPLLPSIQGYPSACFALATLPSAALPSSAGPSALFTILVPDVTAGTPSASIEPVATLVDASFSLPSASVGFCWAVEFCWVPSVIALDDDLEGLWSYRQNSPDGNQYWNMSTDETSLWTSDTWVTVDGQSSVMLFPANVDYASTLISADAVTTAAVAPTGFHGTANPFYAGPIENGAAVPGTVFDLNQGFDVGTGADAVSFTGTGGAASPFGTSNQALANNPPDSHGVGANATTLGFVTWDNGGAGGGSGRIVMATLDLEGLQCLPDGALGPDIVKNGQRLPVNGPGYGISGAINGLFMSLFAHTTAPGWRDADLGYVDPFGWTSVGGHSIHLPLGAQPGVCVGIPINLTYGSLPLKASGKIDFANTLGTMSGSRELFLMP